MARGSASVGPAPSSSSSGSKTDVASEPPPESSLARKAGAPTGNKKKKKKPDFPVPPLIPSSPQAASVSSPLGAADENGLPPPPPPPSPPPKTLKSAQVWDVVAPPPVNSVKGHILPKTLQKIHRRRRISVEVHRVLPSVVGDEEEEQQKEVDDDKSTRSGRSHQKVSPKIEGKKTTPVETQSPKAKSHRKSVSADFFKSLTTLASTRKKIEHVDEYEQCFIRILVPASSKEAKAAAAAAKEAKKKFKQTASAVGAAVHIMQTTDQASVSTVGDKGVDDDDDVSLLGGLADDFIVDPEDGGGSTVVPPQSEWVPKYKLPLQDVEVNKRVKNACVVTTKYRKINQTREIIFNTEKEAIAFCNLIVAQKGLQDERDKMRFKANLGGIKLKPGEQISLLVEIVSGWDLPAGDFISSDPYVEVTFEGKKLHKTKHIPKTLEPVWTLTTDAFFILSMPAKEFFECHEGVCFEVKDFDKFGGHESLGGFIVPPKMLYEAKGARMNFKLKPLQGKKNYGKGNMTIRCRHASEYDRRFMDTYSKNKKQIKDDDPMGIDKAVSKVIQPAGGKGDLKSIMTRHSKIEKVGPGQEVRKFKVRPGPDPKRKEETEWMTKEDISKESMKESHQWLDVGSGQLGNIYLEVIGCDDLPNLDTGGMLGNKTDTFVSVVYEDCVVKTDVIDDCLAPRWLPWSQRAFIFHMMHSSSQIFLGVFDYDSGSLNDHDLIGRVSMDISNFRADTEYILKYNIYPTAKLSDRKDRGSITIRLRIEIEDERKLLLSNLDVPPVVHVNVKTRKDFRVVRYTCTGKYNMEKYSMKTINAYIEELISYSEILYYVQDGLVNLLMWRGHFPVTFRVPTLRKTDSDTTGEKPSFLERYTKKTTIRLPIHSMNAFLAGVTIVERPSLLPSFFFAWIAWLLIAVMGYRRNNPNPWGRCKSFGEFMQILVLGKSTTPPHSIAQYENAAEASAFIKAWTDRIKKAEEQAAKRNEEYLKEQEQLEKEMEEIGQTDVDISTKAGFSGPSIDPFKPILFPIQQYLATICDWLRFSKNVVIWEECYFAFWLSFGSLILAFCFLFVPWTFLICWTSRIVVWSVLGPWVKLFDIFYFSKIKPLTEEEEEERKEELARLRKEATKAAATEARIKREEASKLKDFKQYMFGRFITKVPILKLDRYRDSPLPASQATPYKPKPLTMPELAMREAGRNRTRVTGQHLVGEMIPRLEVPRVTEAPTGQPTKHTALLDKDSPGANLSKDDSNVAAYTKIGSVVLAAGLITWFGVPLIISFMRWMMQAVSGALFTHGK